MTPTPQNPCCRTCLSEKGMLPTTFIACPVCGNKRCPRATDHRLECTGSNKPGQPGSVYGALATCSTCNAKEPCLNVTKPGGKTEWACIGCWTRKRENERRDDPPVGVFGGVVATLKQQEAGTHAFTAGPAKLEVLSRLREHSGLPTYEAVIDRAIAIFDILQEWQLKGFGPDVKMDGPNNLQVNIDAYTTKEHIKYRS